MSGAAALSAAKNRRGNSQQQQQVPNRNRPGSQQTSCAKPPSEPPKHMHPLEALQMHEIKLGQMEKKYSELQNSIQNLSSLPAKSDAPNKMENAVATHLRDMLKRISQVEEMFHHLKEDIFRVQTFAMETNISFLKYTTENKSIGASAPVPASAPLPVPVPVSAPLPVPVSAPLPVSVSAPAPAYVPVSVPAPTNISFDIKEYNPNDFSLPDLSISH